MKKIILSLIALVATVSINAHVVNVSNTKSAFEEEQEHEYVEIGGLKWATMNLGATTVAGSPSTSYGDYYGWGETEPRYTSITISGATSVSVNGWSCSHSNGYKELPSYTSETLDADHDAATQNWGSDWRMTTNDDFRALTTACTGGSTSSYQDILSLSTEDPNGGIYFLSSTQTYLPEYKGVAGILFVDRTDTSKRVFFPMAGYLYNTSYYNTGMGQYWSSSLLARDNDEALNLRFFSSYVYPGNVMGRWTGNSVRPVSELTQNKQNARGQRILKMAK